jgi:hypothetical protein
MRLSAVVHAASAAAGGVGVAAGTGVAVWFLGQGPLHLAGSALASAGPVGLLQVPFGTALSAGCAVALAVCWAWLVVTAGACVVQTCAGARRSSAPMALAACSDRIARHCPRLVRSAVAAGCALAVGATAVGPATADPGSLTGLAIPDRVSGTARLVVVRPGDSLWSITERLLPDGASDRAITRGWQRLARTNRSRIGADPDLIHPGTRLRVPRLGKDHR